ncbi:hypothetical protein CC86DRAFT_370391, partial [Ophiobolus disseminans]
MSFSEMSTSTAGTGKSTWGRMAQILSPKRRKESTLGGSEYFSAITSVDRMASLSLASLPWSILIMRRSSFHVLFVRLCSTFLL